MDPNEHELGGSGGMIAAVYIDSPRVHCAGDFGSRFFGCLRSRPFVLPDIVPVRLNSQLFEHV